MKRSKARGLLAVCLALIMSLGSLQVFAESINDGYSNGVGPVSVTPFSGGPIWSLAGDTYIQGLAVDTATDLDGTPWVNITGVPEVVATTVAHPTISGQNSLQISNRTADWHGLQLPVPQLNLQPSTQYRIVVTGRVPTGAGNGSMVIRQSGNPWSNLSSTSDITATNRNFNIVWDFTTASIPAGNDMRIQTPGAVQFNTFIVDSIVIGEAPAVFNLTPNGESGVSNTTEITIQFSRDVSAPQLTLADITFDPRTTDATVTALRRISDDQYILDITGVTAYGQAGVTITHSDVDTALRNVTIHYENAVPRIVSPRRSYFPDINNANFVNLMPVSDVFNDPFQFFVSADGQSGGFGTNNRVVTAQDWEDRRAEIRDLVMYYYTGYIWPTTAAHVTVNTTARPDNGGTISVTVNEVRSDGTPVEVTFNAGTGIWLPSAAQLEANGFDVSGGPIIISMGALNEAQRTAALERGIAVAVAGGMSGNGSRTGPYFTLFPFNESSEFYNSGELAATSWAVSRLLDAFELNPQWGVNPNMSATIGNSFQGKRALFGAVMDDRVALAIPHESGGDGGMVPFRQTHVARVNHWHHNGLVAALARPEVPRNGLATRTVGGLMRNILYTSRPHDQSIYLVPFDTHLIASLQAGSNLVAGNNRGRALISLETDGFGHHTGLTTVPNVVAAANEVSAFLGYDGNFIVFQKGSSHAIHNSDFPVIFATLDYLFGHPVHGTTTGFRGNRTADQVYKPNILQAAVPGVWDGGIRALQRTPVEVDSWVMPWGRPDAHMIWTETQNVTTNLPATVVAYTDAPLVDLILWNHGGNNNLWNAAGRQPTEIRRWTATTTGGVATFNIPADEVGIGRYELRTRGGALDDRSAFFQGIDLNTALIQSYHMDGGSTQLGFVSIIDTNALRVYSTNGTVETSLTSVFSQTADPWIVRHGVRLPSIVGAGDNRWWSLRNLQFQAVPGFTFQLNLQQSINNVGDTAWGVNDLTWAPSAAVQNIGPYPGWRPAGNSTNRPDPNNLDTGAMGNRATTFNRTIVNSRGVGNWDRTLEVWLHLDSWVITFSDSINPRDFGIGFDFSTDFDLSWNDENTILTIDFNDFQPNASGEFNALIMRIRNDGAPVGETRATRIANAYNGVMSLYVPDAIVLDQSEVDDMLDDAEAAVNAAINNRLNTDDEFVWGTTVALLVDEIRAALASYVLVEFSDDLALNNGIISGDITLSIPDIYLLDSSVTAERIIAVDNAIEVVTNPEALLALAVPFVTDALAESDATTQAGILAAVNAVLVDDFANIEATLNVIITPPVAGTEASPAGTPGSMIGHVRLALDGYYEDIAINIVIPAVRYVPFRHWRMSEQMPGWGLAVGADVGSTNANPWNAYVRRAEGGNMIGVTRTAEGALRYESGAESDNGMRFVLQGNSLNFGVGDVITFYFTAVASSGGGNGIFLRPWTTVGTGGNYGAPFQNPAPFAPGTNWTMVVGTEYVVSWTLTAECLARHYLQLAGRHGFSSVIDITDITVMHANPAPADRTALNLAIAEAEARVAQDYTAESWANMQAALSSAINIRDTANAIQIQVDTATSNLNAAVAALVLETVVPVDRAALNLAIAAAEAQIQTDFTPESWADMQIALSSAIAVRNNTDATQAQVDAAVTALDAAVAALVSVDNINRAALVSAIVAAEARVEADYTPESWANMQSALSSAIAVRDGTDMTQAQIDTAVTALNAAVDALVRADAPTFAVSITNGGDGYAGQGLFAAGERVTINAGARADYTFNSWNINPAVVFVEGNSAAGAITTFIMPATAVIADAQWTATSPGALTVTIVGSTAADSGAGEYEEGDIVTVNAGTRVGYNFNGWTSNPPVEFANENNPITTFEMIDVSVTVTANWIRIVDGGNGGHQPPPAQLISVPAYIPARPIPQSASVVAPVLEQITITGGNVVNAQITGGRATVRINAGTVRNIIASDESVVEFDLSNLNITSAGIPTFAIRQFANADVGMEIALPQGTISLDPDAVAVLAAQAHTHIVVFRITEIHEEQLSAALAARIPEGAVVHQVSISSGSRVIRDFGDEMITVTLPFDGDPPVYVWRIGTGGSLIPLEILDTSNGFVTFITDVLGLFVVGRP